MLHYVKRSRKGEMGQKYQTFRIAHVFWQKNFTYSFQLICDMCLTFSVIDIVSSYVKRR